MPQPLEARFQNGGVRIVSERPVTVVLKDVANALGYRDAHNIRRSIKDKYLRTHDVSTNAGLREMLCVTRPGLSQALATLQPRDEAKRKKVEAFQDWLYEDVLESIYDTGSYTATTNGDPEADKMLRLAKLTLAAIEEEREHLQRLERDQEHTEHEVEKLEDRVEDLEAAKQAPATAKTRFGHDVGRHTWDGMRRTIVNRVQADQQRTGNGFSAVWNYLYDSVERKYGFHALRIKDRRGGRSGIKALDFDEMRAVLAVSEWLFA